MDIDPDIVEALESRGAAGELMELIEQGEACGWCRRPVRLFGERRVFDPTTGERTTVFSSTARPDDVVLKPCGNRRETRCPTCAAVYRGDARHLVKAGLQGGKGIDESVAGHPAVLLTLTAPGFGAVHRSSASPCHPGAPRRRCPHGRGQSCFCRHVRQDPVVGTPLCPDCYDYEAAVLHNAVVPELWRRTSVYIPRRLARLLGITQAECRRRYQVSYLRVAEFQRRGAVHLHVVVRLDGADGGSPPNVGAELLASACALAARAVAVRVADRACVWGAQLDVAVLDRERSTTGRLAAYVAKYATKSSARSGALDERIVDRHDIAARGLSDHERRLVEAAWALGAEEHLERLHLRRYAHVLGYGGQFLCKSRRYSTTFGALRGARVAWREARRPRLPVETAGSLYEARWMAVGVGWANPGEAKLAEQLREANAYARRMAWQTEETP